jgi:hypothetical protein
MGRYVLEIGLEAKHFLKATDDASARAEARTIVDIEMTPERQAHHARSEVGVYAQLHEVRALETYEIRPPTRFAA